MSEHSYRDNITASLQTVSTEQLRVFCYDEESFVNIYECFDKDTEPDNIVQAIVRHAQSNLSHFDVLLFWLKEKINMPDVIVHPQATDSAEQPQIMLVTAWEDRERAQQLQAALLEENYGVQTVSLAAITHPDSNSLVEQEIPRFNFLCLGFSSHLLNKDQPLSRQINRTLDVWYNVAGQQTYIIVVCFDNSPLPDILHPFQKVTLSDSDNLSDLTEILQQEDTHPKLANINSSESPHGIVPSQSMFYIKRPADYACLNFIRQSEAVTLSVTAPRQTGKSSLINRILYQAEEEFGKKSIVVDIQRMQPYLTDRKNFFMEFSAAISQALNLSDAHAYHFHYSTQGTPVYKSSVFLTEHIIPQLDRPLFLGLDKVEQMLNSPPKLKADFFGMLRSWHEARKNYEENYDKISLFLSISTDPQQHLDDNQSPFNVAEKITLDDFTEDEVNQLNVRYECPFTDRQIEDLFYLISGQPFLTRWAFYLVTTEQLSPDRLLAQAEANGRPFLHHLRHLLYHVLQDPDLKQAMREICYQLHYPRGAIFDRLKMAGLIKTKDDIVMPRNELYTRYFGNYFTAN